MQTLHVLILILIPGIACSENIIPSTNKLLHVNSGKIELVTYKKVDSVSLCMEIHYPPEFEQTKTYPAMIFFHGGGWIKGGRNQFIHHAEYFSKRGSICFLVDYRTREKHLATPFDALKDAKSAIRFIHTNSAKFSVDTSKLIACGGSAGGHLAAATALIEGFNESSDNLSVSCKPNALVLFNPVIDNGPGGYAYDRIGNKYKDFSPLINIKEGAPPTLIMLGTEDQLIPVETAKYYKIVMMKVGSRCNLKLYKNAKHGFWNYKWFDYYKKTVLEADMFLKSLGYLKPTPEIEIK